jgi:hypothetical protein
MMQPIQGHVNVAVPVGHTVQVHAPQPQMEMPTGMIAQPNIDGAKAAMDRALAPAPGPSATNSAAEEAAESPAQEAAEQKSGAEAKEPVHKKKKKKPAVGK